jgi:hypothetical protein
MQKQAHANREQRAPNPSMMPKARDLVTHALNVPKNSNTLCKLRYQCERCAHRASPSVSPSSLCTVSHSSHTSKYDHPQPPKHLPHQTPRFYRRTKAKELAHHSYTHPLFCSINSVHASLSAMFGLSSPIVSVSRVSGSVWLLFRCSMSVARS